MAMLDILPVMSSKGKRRTARREGGSLTQGALQEGQRFVYDGLTLLREAQLYDSDEDEVLEMTDAQRVGWENTTGSGKDFSYKDDK